MPGNNVSSCLMEKSKNGSEGVSNCYVFKSRLQEYAQKVGFPTPVYETTKEGPSHEPSFKSTVTLNNTSYDSLPGFFNRKAAEQSAAEVALLKLAKTDELDQSISVPVHETGLCKNLLQEYAQKMNYAIPSYECTKDESPGRVLLFSCMVDIGGIKYIGGSARTKKEAEIKAARTALLAIQSSSSEPPPQNAQLTVVPCKKRSVEENISPEPDKNPSKAKKRRFNKRKSGTMSTVAAENHDVSTEAPNSARWKVPPYLPNTVQQPTAIPPNQLSNMNHNNGSRVQSAAEMNLPGSPLHPYMANVVQQLKMIPPGQLRSMNPHDGLRTQGPAQQNFSALPLHPYVANVVQPRVMMVPPDPLPNMISRNGSRTVSTSQPNSAWYPTLPFATNVTVPVTITQDQPPVTIAQDQPPVTIAQDQPPVTIAQDQPPVTIAQDQPPVTIAQDQTPPTPVVNSSDRLSLDDSACQPNC